MSAGTGKRRLATTDSQRRAEKSNPLLTVSETHEHCHILDNVTIVRQLLTIVRLAISLNVAIRVYSDTKTII